MKFEEHNYIEIPLFKKNFIYFLNNNNEVVYIGKTTEGLFRPLSHKDKIYNKIKIIYEDNLIMLGIFEDYLINKYKPEYNKLINSTYTLIKARNIFRKIDRTFTVKDLKSLMKSRKMEVLQVNNKQYIKINDMYRLAKELINLGGI